MSIVIYHHRNFYLSFCLLIHQPTVFHNTKITKIFHFHKANILLSLKKKDNETDT